MFHVNSYVYRGLKMLRPQEPSDRSLPVLDTWGYLVPAVLVERQFIGNH